MKIMISAGEVSGDVHGSYLVRELKKLRADLSFFGMGSERLAAEGVDLRLDITKRGTIGIFEALPNLFPIYSAYKKMIEMMKQERPDLLILIDSQGLNVPLAKAAKELKIKTVYYIAPQEWLWGTEAGARKVGQTVDLIVAIFQKEYDIYKKVGANVVYFGHPLIDILSSAVPRPSSIVPPPLSIIISLCPGSRTQEIKTMYPILVKAAAIIAQEMPTVCFVVPAASRSVFSKLTSFPGLDVPLLGDLSRFMIEIGQTNNFLAKSSLAICTSGTINLEASILGIPNIMAYKLSPLTYWIGKHILKIDRKIKYFSMPNILLDEKVIPELIMNDANAENIAREAIMILRDPDRQRQMLASFEKLKTLLGSPGVIGKVAAKLVSMI